MGKPPDREIGKPRGESWKSNRATGLAADGSFHVPGERTLLVTEQFAFQQPRGNSGAVHAHIGTLPP
jgi:hypothetical protein